VGAAPICGMGEWTRGGTVLCEHSRVGGLHSKKHAGSSLHEGVQRHSLGVAGGGEQEHAGV